MKCPDCGLDNIRDYYNYCPNPQCHHHFTPSEKAAMRTPDVSAERPLQSKMGGYLLIVR